MFEFYEKHLRKFSDDFERPLLDAQNLWQHIHFHSRWSQNQNWTVNIKKNIRAIDISLLTSVTKFLSQMLWMPAGWEKRFTSLCSSFITILSFITYPLLKTDVLVPVPEICVCQCVRPSRVCSYIIMKVFLKKAMVPILKDFVSSDWKFFLCHFISWKSVLICEKLLSNILSVKCQPSLKSFPIQNIKWRFQWTL